MLRSRLRDAAGFVARFGPLPHYDRKPAGGADRDAWCCPGVRDGTQASAMESSAAATIAAEVMPVAATTRHTNQAATTSRNPMAYA